MLDLTKSSLERIRQDKEMIGTGEIALYIYMCECDCHKCYKTTLDRIGEVLAIYNEAIAEDDPPFAALSSMENVTPIPPVDATYVLQSASESQPAWEIDFWFDEYEAAIMRNEETIVHYSLRRGADTTDIFS